MRKLLLALTVIAAVVYFTGCKKCFNCQNTCQKCVLADSGVVLYQTICTDDSTIGSQSQYNAAIQHATSLGYVCTATAPTYNQDYCVNQPGDSSYMVYYDRGGRVPCKPK